MWNGAGELLSIRDMSFLRDCHLQLSHNYFQGNLILIANKILSLEEVSNYSISAKKEYLREKKNVVNITIKLIDRESSCLLYIIYPTITYIITMAIIKLLILVINLKINLTVSLL